MDVPDLKSISGLQALFDTTPLHRWLGFRVRSVEMWEDVLVLVVAAPVAGNAERSDGAGQAHGGAIATLIDTTATFAASAALGRLVPTMNLRVDYLRPATGAEMVATAKVRRAGRTAVLVDVDLEAGKLAAVGRCVLAASAG